MSARGRPARPTPVTLAPLLINGVVIAGVCALAKVSGEGDVSALGVLSWQVLFAAIVVGVITALSPLLTYTSALIHAHDIAPIGAGVLTVAFYLGAVVLQRRGGPHLPRRCADSNS